MIRRFKHKAEDFIIRGRKGWAPRDSRNLDSYLTKVMIESIEYHKNTTISCPVIHPDSWKKDTYGGTLKLWKAINDVIIDGLKAHQRLVEMDYPEGIDYNTWAENQTRKFNAGWILLGEYWGALWD